ncbi:putative calcium-activated chloride channel regulator 1-like [Apostichopus japonicus]|uniref:Putative calcium-activated chloride channel regulator 1-like n=1 Tax=Stichopus japonicus TaxID=307972 RepID=A0A2G8KME2_STIJA|nr:putative calcium-activated chloride channel regulator 1-like [Apostichopus japonicus]
MVRDASSYLYQATKKRAYFKNVTILIPDTWQDKPEYESPKNATFEGADVIIAPRNPRYVPDANVPPTPYTKHYEGCGKQAVHIHLTQQFLLEPFSETLYGNRGRAFVHEWAHLRWGLFNEYSDEITDTDNAQSFYYSLEEQVWKSTRSSCKQELAKKPSLAYQSRKLTEVSLLDSY